MLLGKRPANHKLHESKHTNSKTSEARESHYLIISFDKQWGNGKLISECPAQKHVQCEIRSGTREPRSQRKDVFGDGLSIPLHFRDLIPHMLNNLSGPVRSVSPTSY